MAIEQAKITRDTLEAQTAQPALEKTPEETIKPMTASVPANRTPEQIRASIEETRRELAFSVNDLRSKVTEIADWRRQLVREPRRRAHHRGRRRLRRRRRHRRRASRCSAAAAEEAAWRRHRRPRGLRPPRPPASCQPLPQRLRIRRASDGGALLERRCRRGWLVRLVVLAGADTLESAHSRTAIWIVAATGTAISAPSTPSSVPPNSTETITRNGLMSTARFWICGWIRLFSTCW